MSSTTPFSPITPSDLFAELAAGASAGMVVLTPNARLAQVLSREFDAAQAAAGLTRWETADILPWTAFAARLYEDALYAADATGAALPVLLTPAQEASLWEQAIEASAWGNGALLALSQAAADARRAWNTCHEWAIAAPVLDLDNGIPRNEDAQAFAQWAAHYRRRCARDRLVDAAQLPDLVARLLDEGRVAAPRAITAYAFDILPPQVIALLEACRRNGHSGSALHDCTPRRATAQGMRLPFASARDELDAAARWARARLEAGAANGAPPRIGIVVPELQLRRKEVVRVLARTLSPGCDLPGAARDPAAAAFNVSIGVALTDYPLVHAALGLLDMGLSDKGKGGECDFALASRLVRSPFTGGAQSEALLRARIDARLRRIAPARLTLSRLLALLSDCAPAPALRRHLEALYELAGERRRSRATAEDWAQRSAALLAAAGFPGERPLDSAEYQTHAKWTETLAQFARLGRVLPAGGMGAREALSRLRRLCSDTLFQPESGGAPIQVLGILESAGLAFDHLWVSGLTDEAWPLAARPDPFIPTLLQKKAGIPEASAEGALALDRRITQHWLEAAPEVVLSHPLREEDRELQPSPLVTALPEGTLELPPKSNHRGDHRDQRDYRNYRNYRDLLFAARALEAVPAVDGEQAPALAIGSAVHGGARVLADQAACPFRAFAHHRLGAEALDTPVEGLDAAARGTLLHALMKGIWDELRDKATLDATSDDSLAAIAARSAAAAVARVEREQSIAPRLAALERERLVRLALDWLAVERERADFTVVATEQKRALVAGGIALTGRIDRLDRLGANDAGDPEGYALIDYKSGRVTPNAWLGERPDDPQLPLYAANAAEPVTAMGFARIRKGTMRMMGFSRDDKVMPKVKKAIDWDALMTGWRAAVDELGHEFAAGTAGVDPKDGLKTCRYCDLAPLCRVHEKFSALELDAAAGAEDGAGSEGSET